MAVEVTSGATIITGEHIAIARLLTLRSGLGLEIKTGMKLTRGRSPLAIIQGMGITNKRTKKGAYADLDAHIVSLGGQPRPLV